MTTAERCVTPGCANPRPPRRDGKPGTHHRCDDCHQKGRRDLCRVLVTGRWVFAAQPDPAQCSQCVSPIPPGAVFFRFGESGPTCCRDCATDCGWQAELYRASPGAPNLASAWLGYHEYDGPLFVVFHVPSGQPAVCGSAVHLVGALARGGLQSAIGAGEPGIEVLSVVVSARQGQGAVKVAAQIAIWLTGHAQRVTVPREWYDDIRSRVWDVGASRAARRLSKRG